mmetsp:Transcript_31380/g.67642  ORF Transcript_31380/g.67642 Transcript_31380/m.67642 type:complete len:241 (-) Transcript_31380:359-1081(-)
MPSSRSVASPSCGSSRPAQKRCSTPSDSKASCTRAKPRESAASPSSNGRSCSGSSGAKCATLRRPHKPMKVKRQRDLLASFELHRRSSLTSFGESCGPGVAATLSGCCEERCLLSSSEADAATSLRKRPKLIFCNPPREQSRGNTSSSGSDMAAGENVSAAVRTAAPKASASAPLVRWPFFSMSQWRNQADQCSNEVSDKEAKGGAAHQSKRTACCKAQLAMDSRVFMSCTKHPSPSSHV